MKVIKISDDNYEKLLLYQAILQYKKKKKVSIDAALSDILGLIVFKNLDQATLNLIISQNPILIEKLLRRSRNGQQDNNNSI